MIAIAAFLTMLLLAGIYATLRGGAPERLAAAMMAIAAAATLVAPWEGSTIYRGVHWSMLIIDTALLIGLTVIALFADRFWPMWLAALQLVAVGAHGARGYEPDIWAISYWWLVNKIAYPMVGLLVVATARHRRRIRWGLPEHAWTYQRARADEQRRRTLPTLAGAELADCSRAKTLQAAPKPR